MKRVAGLHVPCRGGHGLLVAQAGDSEQTGLGHVLDAAPVVVAVHLRAVREAGAILARRHHSVAEGRGGDRALGLGALLAQHPEMAAVGAGAGVEAHLEPRALDHHGLHVAEHGPVIAAPIPRGDVVVARVARRGGGVGHAKPPIC